MTLEAIFVLVLVLAVFIAFVWEKYPPEVVALTSCAALLLTDVLGTEEFLSVFSNSAPITIAMMLILSAALERTGVLQVVSNILKRKAKGSYLRSLFIIMFFCMVASAFMNNTPIVLMLTPVVISLAASVNMTPSKLLIPLSFASIFGGTLTLVGTSSNILMSSIAADHGQAEIGMFEMTLPGLCFVAVGFIYMLTVGRWLLPDRLSLSDVMKQKSQRKFIAEVFIPTGSTHIGKTVTEFAKAMDGARLIDMVRHNISVRRGMHQLSIKAGDRLILKTGASELLSLKEDGEVEFTASLPQGVEPVTASESLIMEASISLKSRLIGRRVAELGLARKYGVYVIAVHREDESINENFDKIKLKFGDTLLLEGAPEGIKRLIEDGNVINLTEPQDRPIRRAKAPVAFMTILVVMVLAAMEVLPIAGLAIIGASVVLLTRCVDPDEAFEAIDWRILFLIFGMLGLSLGLEKTGAAQWLVSSIVTISSDVGPHGILFAVYLVTALLTQMVSNNAVAVLIGPIVIALAQQLGLDPRPFIMAVMFAASASFATPIGYQTNTFIYVAGGYKFNDFLKVGVPLNLLFAIVATVVIPWFFPL
ncbi:SLC13 family permease [Kangiella sediminilitoris]|uniref:Citrate transporter n=1 Tax=Kangiella sediminilitoris TaxID=1144748 RepID=A0A1B3BDM9_9GAMM|nr:SLC13 family permease [Kangiella sediminilitoris]AOE50900.1 citrate transporter [Kangiella sediminilitoris]